LIALREDSVLGTYRVQGLLGRGGTAEVWEVRHTLLGTRHALKVPTLWRGRPLQRLLREARVQARLRHPNLLAVQGLLELEGRPALLLPLVEGPSLSRLLSVYRPAAREGIALVRSIAEGVGFAHASGLVHRDLKPSNVLLELVGGVVVARVSDFGLVKEWGVSSSLTGGGSVGTPLYMSPEQLRSPGEVDRRADLWSLGVILFELLTGALPFNARSLPELIEAHRRPLAAAQLTDEQASVLRALLDPDPGGRPASCEALLEQLDAMNGPGPDPLVAGSSLADAVSAMSRRRPPSLSASALHNLPARRDRFLGRAAELSSLEGRLAAGARLISLVGPGGVGKTRLALELCERVAGGWPDGVWLCDLVGVRTGEAASAALARALGSDGEPEETLRALGRALLVLDGLEPEGPALLDTLGRWQRRAPLLTLLTTSRLPPGLSGAWQLALGPLEPDAARELFVERARAVRPDFTLTAHNHHVVDTLLEELEGSPLLIELAAQRARRLTPARLLARLSDPLSLLCSESGDRPERQRSLHASLHWTWELLSEAERALLLRAAQAPLRADGDDAVAARLEAAGLLRSIGGRLAVPESLRRFLLLTCPGAAPPAP
jgi:hypothetical protein